MTPSRSRSGDILAALFQGALFVALILMAIGVVAFQAVTAIARPLTSRLPSFSEFATVFPQILLFLFLLIAVPVTLVTGALSAGGRKILNLLQGIEALIGGGAYFLAFAMVFAEIIAREVFGSTIGGTQEAAILGAVIAGFMGFALVSGAGAHLRVNLLDGLAPKKNEETFLRFTDLVAVILLTGIAIAAGTFVQGTYEYADRVRTLLIPLWPFQLVLIYAFGASALKHLIYFINPELRPIPPVAAH